MSQTHLVLILSLTSLCAGQIYEVNVAINKYCNQSSTYENWFAAKAVDNKLYEQNYENCMHTAEYDYDPWWAVDLGQVYPVLNLKLYIRGNMFSRVVNSTITVDEQFCTKIYPLPSTNPLDLRCKYLIYGQRINITRDRYGDYYLNFCEFQVLVPNDVIACGIGKFGTSCQEICSTACGQGQGKNACHKDGGKCYGCIDGKAGDTCSEACTSSHCLNNKCYQDNRTCIDCTDYFLSPDCTECKPGFYGDNCNIPCKSGNCLNKMCDRNSGECLQCQGNFKPPSCMECIDGYRGIGCNMPCNASCYLKCNQTNGSCFQCYPGWQGKFCGKACDTGFYGDACNASCGQCLTPPTCNHTNGYCSSCNPGYIPPLCQEECLDGTYGIDCKNACGQCAVGTTCDKRLGTCHKCVPGKMVPYCIQDCKNGTYGEDCKQTCGHCENNTSCNVSNGHCFSCQMGFQSPFCIDALKADEGSDNHNNNNMGYIIGPVIAVLVVLIIVIVVIFVIRKRRRMPKDVYSNMSDETNMDVGRQSTDNTRGSNEATHGSKPKAAVKPQAHGKPDNMTSSGVIYENITKTHNEPPNTKPKPNQRELNATSLTSKSSPKVSKGKLFKPNEKEINLLKADDNDETPVDEQSLGVDNDYYTVDVADTVYSNDVPLSNFDPVGIPVDLLQNYILDKLKSGTLEAEFSTLSPKMEYAHECGLKQENHYKNRFNSILPYDSTRVVLNKLKDDDSSDYINANYIRGHGQTTYIAAQGPKNNTVQDFWRMVWQEHVKHIVMLTNVQENAKAKCYEYWPQKGAKMTYGQIEVKGLEESRRAHYVIRAFSVKNVAEEEKRRVEHLQYVSWFDHDVPQATPLVDFWRYAKTRASQRSTAPLLVHCSAGVGRTGTYLALDILLDQTEHEKEVNIYGVVRRMREDRCNMVQNKKQYEFLHEVILEAYASRNTRYDVTNFEKVFPHPISTDSANTRIDQEFKTLQFMRDSLSRPSHSNALLEENRSKNRNSTALPDDKHLVYLSPFVKGRNQYINAVYLSTFLDARGSILTQLPFPETLVDIWRLIDGCGIETIVSIRDVSDKEKDSCRYWPQSEGEVIKTGIYTVTLKSKVNLGTSLISYGLDLQNQEKSESREVRVLHYMDWEREIPTNIPELFEMIELLRSNSDVTDGKCIPVLVQCIDGASKSGLFCALWEIISRIICDNEIDVYIAVRNVQIVRPEAVTSHAHYRYCYQVAQQYRTSTNVYANT